jgi:UDP-GlcNAc:undecaprenyl-phosphate GlcNAc-1-phosphate transferase
MFFFFSILTFLNLISFFIFSRLSKKINIYDFPDKKRKLHSKPVPAIGGLFVFNALVLGFIYMNIYVNPLFPGFKNLISFFFAGLFIFILGVFDDKFFLKPNTKLSILFFIVLILILINDNLIIKQLNFSFWNKKIYLENFSILFTVICILLFLNAFNMIDGINLIAGLYSFLLFLYLYLISDNEFYLFFLISLPFFLIKNFQNKSFLGDGGSLLIAFILSICFIRSYQITDITYCDEIFLIMLIPGLDMLRLFFERIVSGKNPFQADRNHLHHLLINNFSFSTSILILLILFFAPIFISYVIKNLFISIVLSIFLYSLIIFFFQRTNKKNVKKA